MNFSQIPFLAVFALPIFSKNRPHVIVIIVDDLGERINSKQRPKLKYTIETDKDKDKAYGQRIPGWADVPWNNPDSVATRIGNYAKYDFLDLGIPIVNKLPALHCCHLCAGCCTIVSHAGHYDCFADKE